MMAESSLDPRIRIRAPLRCDGIGRLDWAEDSKSGGRLAVRWLPLDANGDAAVKACARLPEHPRLPRILQTGQVGGSAFVAMDFPEGALLSTRAGERLEVDAVIRLGSQLSSALATVHAQGVVHGEMSTDSVLLVEPDHAYLWDMPLVIANRLTDRRGENRLMQNLVKTAPFLAPERARGEGASQASDVYALGAVLCVAAGAPLPVASTTLGVVHQVAQGEWTPRVPMVLPEPYRSTLARMVSADPAQRPSADDVAQVFSELPPAAALPTVPEFPVVKLPPELLAAADALLRRPSVETPKVPAEPGLSRENAIPEGVNLSAVTAEARARSGQVPVVTAAAAQPTDDFGTADTQKRAAVARAEAKSSDTKASTSGPQSAAAVAAKATAPAESPVTTSGPQSAAVVAKAAAQAESPATTSGPQSAAAGKTGTSGPQAAVQLRDNVAVSAELAEAGAVALSDEEVAALQRSRRQVILVAAGLGGAILALLTVAFLLATSHVEPVVVPAPHPATVVPAVPVPEPVKAKPADADDELAPLAPLPMRPASRPAAKPAPKAVTAPAPAAPVQAAEAAASDVAVTPAPTKPADFDFLDSSAEAPTAELKRPSM